MSLLLAKLGAGSGITGAIAWTEDDDLYAITGNLTVTSAFAWIEADDTAALTGAVTVSGAWAWTEADDAMSITGTVVIPVDGTLAWTEEDDAYALTGAVEFVAPVVSGGGGGGWIGATRAEEKRLLAQIEAVLRETLSPKKAAPILKQLAGVDAVAQVRAEVERMAEVSRADARTMEVLAEVQAKIAIYIARRKRMRDDHELMMVL